MWPKPCGARRMMCLASSDSRLVLMRLRWLNRHRRGEGTDMLKLNPEERLFVVAHWWQRRTDVINPASEEVAGSELPLLWQIPISLLLQRGVASIRPIAD